MSVDITDAVVRINDLCITRRDVLTYLEGIATDERENALEEAIEVGCFVLQRARTGRELEFVKRSMEGAVAEVERALMAIPSLTEKALVARIGAGDGQVLAPIQALVNDVARTTSGRLRDVKELLANDLDPSKDSSSLGLALRSLKELLDPKRKDSVQGSFEAALAQVTAEDGALAKTIKAAVLDTVKSLADDVDRLGREIRGRDAALEALGKTIEKGATYEDDVVDELRGWSRICGAEVFHVGIDKRPGDVIVKCSADSMAAVGITLVIESRDHASPAGRRSIAGDMARAMAERGANVGLYLSRHQEGLAKEIGEWAEGESDYGPWVATTHRNLLTAIRFLVMRRRLIALRESKPDIDAGAVEGQLRRIRTAMGRVTNINRKAGEIRETAAAVQTEASALRDEVRGALAAVEDTIRVISGDQPTEDVA